MTLSLASISKSFGTTKALTGVDLTLRAGEVHAVLGENGAGKTTLMRIAAGLLRSDAGTILLNDAPVRLRSPRDARHHGIGMVHQHSTAVPALSVMENIALTAGWSVSPGLLRRRVEELTSRLGLPLDPAATAASLSVGFKQRLEIVKALASEANVLLLDEPTAVLSPAEAEELLRFVRGFAAAGGAVALITHKLDEALDAADRVTVLRRGLVTLAAPRTGVTAEQLTEAMIGGALAIASPPVRPSGGQVLVRAESLEVTRETGTGLRGATFSIRAGELVVVAGVEGNGQRELLRAVAGLRRPFRGVLDVARPVAFIPEDRSTEGLIPAFDLTENVVLGVGRIAPWIRGRRLRRVDWRAARERTAELLAAADVRAPGPDVAAASLSGGNQQKLLVARALERRPRVLVAENPTRGLDIRSAAAVHARFLEAAAGGAAVLMYSNDLDEVLQLGSRILVAAGGFVSEAPAETDRLALGALMLRTDSGDAQ